jgi:predicted amidohydrolase
VLAAPDGTVHRYRKIHPFSYGGEHEVYDAGAEHVVVDVDGLRVALFVCYDLRFADEFWALAHDTDCYLVVANWPESRREHWRALLVARAIENQAYVVGANRVGNGGGLDYVGDSRIVDPLGEVLAEATGGEAVLIADVDPARVIEVRKKFPFLADRR